MDYAVIKVNGKQYKVSEGEILTLDRLDFKDKKSISFEEVLLLVNADNPIVGNPTVSGAAVEASFVEDKKGDKVRVSKFKAKSRYRKTIGFRAAQTVVKIEKISFKEEKTDKKTIEPTKTAPNSKKI